MNGRQLVFVGDVHLEPGDPATGAFFGFLEKLGTVAERVVFMGDLFSVWIGQRELEQRHQRAVVERIAALRRCGVKVVYLEGNRDFRVAAAYRGIAFDMVSDSGHSETWAGRRWFAIHGDLANPQDRLYRLWRRAARSAPVWAAFRALPRESRLRVASWLERRLRSANPAFKSGFPEDQVRAYAARWLGAGYDAVVLGHFHQERRLDVGGKPVFVLPEWRESRRSLCVSVSGEAAFCDAAALG